MATEHKNDQLDARVHAGPLLAVIDSLERGRALFWSGSVLVEFDGKHIPSGQVTMVLDQSDFALLLVLKKIIKEQLNRDKISESEHDDDDLRAQLTTLDHLGGLISDEAELLAKFNLDSAAEFEELAEQDSGAPWPKYADWKKMRARLFLQLAAEESRAQEEYERQQEENESQERP